MRRRPTTDPSWATRHETYPSAGGCFSAKIPFGDVHWDGSRSAVEIREYYGPRVLGRGTDPGNPWRNGRPQAAVNIRDSGPEQLRAAAAALIAAAELIEAATAARI